ncbi:oligosaccharide flippase family protein [Butyricicoccus faecihominis]|uniref:oligosaccharide flippase family protein n=1 Tax=Butyricicoccus faecihominis TaxID=1712515 RepID=UPI002479A25C|nr:oligosaccharide flippase family protein [Butyricicoccus faecihominis]
MRIRKKTILYAASVLACGNIALQALGFLYRVLLSHYAGAEGLGVYRLVNSAYLVLNAGCLSGVTMACSRLSAASAARRERGKLPAILRLSFVSFGTMFCTCAVLVLPLRTKIAADLLGDARCAMALPFLLLCLALTGIENIFKSFCIGLEQMQFSAVSEVGEQLIRILAVYFLLSRYHGEDYGVIAMLIFAGMVVSEIFSAVFLTTLYKKQLRAPARPLPVDRVLGGQFFAIALPLSISALASNLLSSAGAVLLPQRLMAAGLTYGQALSALGVVSGMAMPLILLPVALVSSVCTALLPAITAAQAVGNEKRMRSLVGRTISTVGLIALPATAVLVPMAPRLSELIFGQPLSTHYVMLLGAVAVASYYQMASGSLLNALGLQHINVATAILSELMQLAVMYRWAARPTLGIYGYLLAMLLSAIAAFAANLTVLHQHTRFPLRPLRRFGVPVLCALTLFYWTQVCYRLVRPFVSDAVPALLCTALGAVAVYLFVLRLCGVRLMTYLGRRIETSAGTLSMRGRP